MALDLSTLYVVAGLGMLVAALVHLIPVATGRFGRWAALWGGGHLLVGCGIIIAVLNDRIGLGWAPTVGNPGVVIGFALIAGAALTFDRPGARLAPILTIAAMLAVPLAVSADPAQFHLRVAYLNLVRAGFDTVIVIVAVRLARRESLQTGWIVATLFAITIPLFLGRAWLAYHDRIGTHLTGMHDDPGAWLAAGQIAFILFRAFSLLILQAERGQTVLRNQMERDWLTGALNRAGLDRIAGTLAHRSPPTRMTAMMLDIDRFKTLNDRLGHAAGDAALCTLAGLAQDVLGAHGELVRWGGDEFVCLMPDVSIVEARTMGTRIATGFVQAMRETVPPDIVPPDILPSVSIGLIEHTTDTPITTVIARADQAMYRAKRDRRPTMIGYIQAA